MNQKKELITHAITVIEMLLDYLNGDLVFVEMEMMYLNIE